MSSYLWGNAGFTVLRKIPELRNHEPRYDPTVILIADAASSQEVINLRDLPVEKPREKSEGAERAPSVADFHNAYILGRTTPLKVAEAFLQELESSPEHPKAFLDVQKGLCFKPQRHQLSDTNPAST